MKQAYHFISIKKRTIWRKNNERLSIKALNPSFKHDKKINIWGCFSGFGVGKLYKIVGNLDRYQYVQILQNELIPSAELLFPDRRFHWYFLQDNDPKHTSHLARDFLNENNIKVVKFPANSPDLNPIENLWHILKRRTSFRNPRTEDELFDIINEEWNKIDKETLSKLVFSMPKRCQMVIEANGGATKY